MDPDNDPLRLDGTADTTSEPARGASRNDVADLPCVWMIVGLIIGLLGIAAALLTS
jgi:hypothetical protein